MWYILAALCLYAVVLFIIALIASKYTEKFSEFLLADRKLSGPITALGVGASDMSSWLLMALPGSIFVDGFSRIWIAVALVIGAYFNWRLIAPRLRILSELNGSLTLPAFLEHRFKSKDSMHYTKFLRIATSLSFIIFFTLYSVSGFKSAAILFQYIFNIDYFAALLCSAVIIVAYTAIGGFLAVNWIDFFQGSLMFISLIVVPVATYANMDPHKINWHTVMNDQIYNLGIFSNLDVFTMLSLIGWGFGYFGQPHILVRFMAISSHKELPIARFICMNWMQISLIGAIFTGFFGAYYYNNALKMPETVFLKLAVELFHPFAAGVLLSAVLSATMSTVSALLLLTSNALVEDIYHAFIRLRAPEDEYLAASRAGVIVAAFIAITISAIWRDSTILEAVALPWSGLGASFGPVIILSLFWPRMNSVGAIAGILTGGIVVILWDFVLKSSDILNPNMFLPGFSILPGFFLSIVAIILGSLMSKVPQISTVRQLLKTKQILAQD